MSCAACGCAEILPKLEKDGVRIVACRACGTAFWRPEADFQARRIYDDAYFSGGAVERGYDDYGSLEASLRATFRRRLAALERPRDGGLLLDLGAAYGFAAAEARQQGWQAYACDVSRDAAQRAAAQAPGRVAVASADALPFAAGSVDLVTLWDVIEHLPDPRAAIREVARVLRPGGRLVLTTGDVGSWLARLSGRRWHLYTLPEHLFFFSRDGLRTLLESGGFRVESMRAEGGLYSAAYLVERLRKTALGRLLAWVPRAPLLPIVVPLNLFDVVSVRAVRSEEAGP